MMKDRYTLTDEDKSYLIYIGALKSDMAQIQEGINNVKITCKSTKSKDAQEKRIGISRAIELLGKSHFLSAMDRATFHWATTRLSTTGMFLVSFDLSDWWRKNMKE